MQVEDALARYVRQLRANGRSEHTVLQVQRHVRLLAKWLALEKKSSNLRAIDEDVVAEFLTSDTACMTARGARKQPGTLNALRSSLRSFFGHATRAGWVTVDPARFVKRAICSPPPPRALTKAEEEQLRDVLASAITFEERRDRVLIELMLSTGVRLSSGLGLDVDDLDFAEGTATLRHVKGGRAGQVYLHPTTQDLLAALLGDRRSGPIFATRDGRRISSRHAQRRFRALRAKAGMGRTVTPHSCRHRFATQLYQRTGDLLVVKEALGHRSIGSSLTYARAGQERVRSAVLAGSSA